MFACVRSENTLIGATNDENGKINSAIDFLPQSSEEAEGTIPEIAKRYKARGQPWMIVTDVSCLWNRENCSFLGADEFDRSTAQLRRGKCS